MNDKRRKLGYLTVRYGRRGARIYKANKKTRAFVFRRLMKIRLLVSGRKRNRDEAKKFSDYLGKFDSVKDQCERIFGKGNVHDKV